MEENRVLEEPLERLRLRFTDEQRIQLVVKVEALGHRALREYVAHFHSERNHQGVGNRLLEPCAKVSPADGPIHCRECLGSMLNFYYREAA